jgi:D-aminopeptidase
VDVPGVLVGHRTLAVDPPDGEAVRTGVTAIVPHGGNIWAEPVLGACHVVNGYGKAAGLTQLAELGTVESPILLTGTLSVGSVWEGGLRHVLDRNPEAGVRDTVNVIVGECFDGHLSHARGLPVRPEHALEAIAAARDDEASEGSVGAGTGATCLGFKAGVGTASRVTEAEPAQLIGSLVVANYGRRRDLHLLVSGGAGGAPAEASGVVGGSEASEASGAGRGPPPSPSEPDVEGGGSAMVVLATDAPLSERQLRRLAARGAFGLGRAAGFAPNPSGDYVIAFSTAHRVARAARTVTRGFRYLRDDGPAMRDLFEAAAETTYEAVLNSLCVADAMTGRDGRTVEAFPYELLPRLRAL